MFLHGKQIYKILNFDVIMSNPVSLLSETTMDTVCTLYVHSNIWRKENRQSNTLTSNRIPNRIEDAASI